jgi:hypothetical protein
MTHLSKVFQAIDRLLLNDAGGRLAGTGMVSCVGVETCDWSSPLALEGKVEQYMNAIIDKMRAELKNVLHDSVKAYPSKPRTKWQFDWPSQVILVVNQIYWCHEVEEAFMNMKTDKGAMKKYNQVQIQQLTDLIQVTRSDLKKADRQKVMNMITIDAHSRDMIEQIVDSGSSDVESFQWVCQLRTYWDKNIDDCRIRVCDASFPYGYEYLGNGPRLVITPLTDRIYITATQVCALLLGGTVRICAKLSELKSCRNVNRSLVCPTRKVHTAILGCGVCLFLLHETSFCLLAHALSCIGRQCSPHCCDNPFQCRHAGCALERPQLGRQGQARQRQQKIFLHSSASLSTSSIVRLRWTTGPWETSSKASQLLALGAASMSSIASYQKCFRSALCSTSV